MLASIAADPTAWSLDTVLRRDPSSQPLSDGELLHLVKALRAERAAIDVKQERKRAKAQGVEDDEESENT